MAGQKKNSPLVGKYVYGLGGLTAVTEVVFVLLFLSGFRAAGVHPLALFFGSLAGIALPSALMPLFYAFINGNTHISVGRYHLPLVLAGVLSTVSFVWLLAVGGHPVGQTFALAGLLFCYALSMQIYSYAYYSIGRRMVGSGAAQRSRSVFSAASAVVGVLIVFWLWDGSRDSMRDVFGFAALLSLLACVAVYFSTVSMMPSFLRVEPKHRRSVREQYARFFAPLRRRSVLLCALSAVLTNATFFLAAATIPSCIFGYASGLRWGFDPAVLLLAAFLLPSSIGFTVVARRKGTSVGSTAIIVLTILQWVCAVSLVCFLLFPVPVALRHAARIAFVVASGISLGAAFADETVSEEATRSKAGCSPGKYHCLHNCFVSFGMALGALLTSVVNLLNDRLGGTGTAVTVCLLYATVALFGAVLRTHTYVAVEEADEREEDGQESEQEITDTAAADGQNTGDGIC